MIILPSKRTVIIQPPRTGSTSQRVAISEKYPDALIPYQHMERSGIPEEYKGFAVIGVVREPVERLYSIYRYMRTYTNPKSDQTWIQRMHQDANRSFSEWLKGSTELFTDSSIGTYDKKYETRYHIPVTRKSQKSYLEPELGPIEIVKIEDTNSIEERLDITLPKINTTAELLIPPLFEEDRDWIEKYFAWDLSLYR